LLSTASVAAAAFILPSSAAAQTTTPPSTTCAVSTINATTFNCMNGTTAASTLTVTSGTFSSNNGALTLSSTDGNIAATAVAATNGVIQNTTAGQTGLTVSNSFAGGTINLSATGQAISAVGTGVDLISAGGPVTVTTGAITSTGNGTFALRGSGGTVTNITTGAITANSAGSSGIMLMGGGGAITLTTGAVTTANNAIVINNGADAITLTTGAVTTTEADAPAVSLTSTGAITATTGLLTTGGGNSAGLMVMGGAGAVTTTVAGARTTGAGSDAISITSAGPVTVTNTGTINVSGDNSVGIDVATTGTGAVNVTTGVVTSTAANVAADPSFAAVRVVAAGAAPVSVNVNGNITTTNGSGVWAQSAGTASVTVAQGVTVSGPTAITLGGTTGNTLVVNGTLTSTTASTPGFVLAVPGAPLNLTIGATGNISGPLAFTTGADAFTNSRTAGFTQSGALDFGAGNDTFTNSTAFTQNATVTLGAGNDSIVNSGTLNLIGTLDFGLGTDSFTNAAATATTTAGIVNLTGATTFLGLETLTNAGTFNQNFNLTMDDTVNAVTNSGTFNAFGTIDFALGADSFTNTATGIFNVQRGATTLLAVDAFTNAGLIDLRDGAANDTLNIGGSYTASGTGARLGIDVVGANNVNTADRLVVGGAIGGTTTVLANFVNPVIDPTGTIIVTAGAGTLAANAFVLGGTTSRGLINFGLENRGLNVFLVARPDEAVFDQLFAGRMANDMWYQSAEAYQSYAMSRRVDYGNDRKGPLGIWAQLYGGRDRFGDDSRQVNVFSTNLTTSNRFEQERRGAQVGLDFGAQNFIAGVTGGYQRAEGDTDFGTELVGEGYNYGAYLQFGAEQGLYAGLMVKRDDFDLRLTNNLIGSGLVSPESRSEGADGEIGLRFGGPGTINFDVGAGLSYVRTRVDDYNFGNVSFDNDRFTSTRGRVQARATFAGTLAPFIDGKVFREFGDANEVTVGSGALRAAIEDERRGTWARVEGGLGGGVGGGPLISGWVDLGDVRGWGVRGGFRF
jgi:hypothetical protein